MLRYGLFAAGMLASGLLAVTTVQAAEQPRIGVVDIQEVIVKSDAGQQAQKILQPFEQQFQAQLRDSSNKLKVLQQQLDKTDKTASNYAQLQKSFNDTQYQLDQNVYLARQNLLQRQQDLLNPIQQDLGQVLDQYAKAHHFDIILSKNNGALYANSKYDVSPGVIEALNKDWPEFQKRLQQQQNTSAPAAKSGG